MSETKTNKKLDLTIQLEDFSQAQFETYQESLLASDAKTVAVKNGAVVKAALIAKILKGIDIDGIPNMKPSAVIWLTRQIHKHVIEVTTPPGDDETDTKNS